METKICTKCNVEKSRNCFYVKKVGFDKIKSICKECESKSKAPKIVLFPDIKGEVWKDVIDYGGVYIGIYQISNFCRLKRIMHRKNPTNKLIKSCFSEDGYICVTLIKNGKTKFTGLHRLVASAFIPNPENKPQVNHKDGNKHNNSIDNLEWSTISENIQHAFDTGLNEVKKGEKHYRTKLTEKDVLEIRKIGASISAVKLGLMYGLNNQAIYKILNKQTWKHI
jgi:hypothetical protein